MIRLDTETKTMIIDGKDISVIAGLVGSARDQLIRDRSDCHKFFLPTIDTMIDVGTKYLDAFDPSTKS